METRSNHVLVGGVVLALLAALALFTVWLARVSGADNKEYDIFFKQSVDGLAKGSAVTFSGVPSGQIKEIKLWPQDPQFVRVRISINEETPILQGTTATIAGVGFTGVSQINLDGAVKGAPPITEPGPAGEPVIPTRPGALGELLNSAPQLIEKLSMLTERVGELLDDRNQNSMRHILANLEHLSGTLSDDAPELRAMLADLRVSVRKAGETADAVSRLAGTANDQLGPMAVDLRRAAASAQRSMDQLDGAIGDARPGLRAFSTQTIPEVSQLIRDLTEMSEALSGVANRVNHGGAGGLISGDRLPDYKPGRH